MALTSEAFELVLVKARDEAQMVLSDFGDESVTEGIQHGAKIDDARTICHASEFALAMLMPGKYIPKREALAEATELIDRLGETKDTGGEG